MKYLVLLGCLCIISSAYSWSLPSLSKKAPCGPEPSSCAVLKQSKDDEFLKNICLSDIVADIIFKDEECGKVILKNVLVGEAHFKNSPKHLDVAAKSDCDLKVTGKEATENTYCLLFDKPSFDQDKDKLTFDKDVILLQGRCDISHCSSGFRQASGNSTETQGAEDKPSRQNGDQEESDKAQSGPTRAVHGSGPDYGSGQGNYQSYGQQQKTSYAPAKSNYEQQPTYQAPAPAPAYASYGQSAPSYETPYQSNSYEVSSSYGGSYTPASSYGASETYQQENYTPQPRPYAQPSSYGQKESYGGSQVQSSYGSYESAPKPYQNSNYQPNSYQKSSGYQQPNNYQSYQSSAPLTYSKSVETTQVIAPLPVYSQPKYQSNGYGQPQGNQYRRAMTKMPFFKGTNAFDDYYASSYNASEVCTSTPSSCPICQSAVDVKFDSICDYTDIIESKFVQLDDNFKFNVTKAIKSSQELADQYDFIINEKCLEECPQLDSSSGLLLFIKNGAPKNECLSIDKNVFIVPSTYMNKFDSKALLKKHACAV